MEYRKAELFKALSAESRIRIVELLRQRGPLGVNQMAEAMGITPSAVSQHLKILRYAGLVQSERKGCCLPYEIDHAAMAQCREVIAEVCDCGCKGTCRARNAEDDLAFLIGRERELREELEEVQAGIRDIQGEG